MIPNAQVISITTIRRHMYRSGNLHALYKSPLPQTLTTQSLKTLLMGRWSSRPLSCQDAADVVAGEWTLSRAGVIVSTVPGPSHCLAILLLVRLLHRNCGLLFFPCFKTLNRLYSLAYFEVYASLPLVKGTHIVLYEIAEFSISQNGSTCQQA